MRSRTRTAIGIALYKQVDSRQRPTSPHWAIVAHETNYLANDVRVFQIGKDNFGRWEVRPKTCSVAEASNLIGIIHVVYVPYSIREMEGFAAGFTATRDEKDYSGLIVWSCEAWVIRFLAVLEERAPSFTLQVRPERLRDHILGTCLPLLRDQRAPEVPIISLC